MQYGPDRMIGFQIFIGDSTYFRILGLERLRDNHLARMNDDNMVFINQHALRELGIAEDAEEFKVGMDYSYPYQIAGIYRDFQIGSALDKPQSAMLWQTDDIADMYPWNILVKIRGDKTAAYNTVKSVFERISDGVKNRKLEGISGAFDLTDRHNGTRIVIEIKTGFDPHAVLVQLFKHTPLQDNFAMNNVALVEGRPHTMGLKEMLQVWVDHRRVVIRRRSEYRKKKALERLHLVEGLLLAMLDIDEVIQVIRTSDDADAAKSRLMVVFDLDEVQAQYILDLRLRRLTKMNRIELEAERDDLKKRIEELTRILASAEALDQVVTDEMDEAVAKWGSPRRTVLLDADPDGTLTPVVAQGAGASGVSKSALEAVKAATTISSAEADVAAAAAAAKKTGEQSTLTGALKIEDEPCVVMMSATGLIARTTPSAMDVFNARSTSDERLRDDQITTIFETSTRATYGLVTSAGRLVLAHVVDLPALPATATLSLKGGVQADELIGMTESTDPIRGERVITAIAMEQPTSGKTSAKDESEDGGAAEAKPLPSLAIGTRNGVIKRWNREAPTTHGFLARH